MILLYSLVIDRRYTVCITSDYLGSIGPAKISSERQRESRDRARDDPAVCSHQGCSMTEERNRLLDEVLVGTHMHPTGSWLDWGASSRAHCIIDVPRVALAWKNQKMREHEDGSCHGRNHHHATSLGHLFSILRQQDRQDRNLPLSQNARPRMEKPDRLTTRLDDHSSWILIVLQIIPSHVSGKLSLIMMSRLLENPLEHGVWREYSDKRS